MRNLNQISKLIILLGIFALSSVSEARLGGGRSMGSRGFRGFGTSAPRNFQSAPRYQQPNSAPFQSPTRPMSPFGSGLGSSLGGGTGSFTRGLMGGIAGGFLGSMLFRQLGHAGIGSGMGMSEGYGSGGGGVGLLEILLFAALAYFVYRMYSNRKAASNVLPFQQMNHYDKLRNVSPGPYGSTYNSKSDDQSSPPTEEAQAAELRQNDSSFDLATFKDQRLDDFMVLQAAWGQRDLAPIIGIVSSEILQEFNNDINQLKTRGEINKIENIAVRSTELLETWVERGKEYATLRFRANLTDYTVSEHSGQTLAGSKTLPIKFEENWTFVRNLDQPGQGNPWKLTAIEN